MAQVMVGGCGGNPGGSHWLSEEGGMEQSWRRARGEMIAGLTGGTRVA